MLQCIFISVICYIALYKYLNDFCHYCLLNFVKHRIFNCFPICIEGFVWDVVFIILKIFDVIMKLILSIAKDFLWDAFSFHREIDSFAVSLLLCRVRLLSLISFPLYSFFPHPTH